MLINSWANIHEKDYDGQTPLIYASMDGYKEIVSLLIDNWANIHEKDNEGKTLLIYASMDGYKEIVNLIGTKILTLH